MKKAYIQPRVRVVTLHVASMIATSVNGVSGINNLGYGGNTSDAGIVSGNAAQRDYIESENIADGWADGLW